MLIRVDGDYIYFFSETNIRDEQNNVYFEYLKFSSQANCEVCTGYCTNDFINKLNPVEQKSQTEIINWLKLKVNKNAVE